MKMLTTGLVLFAVATLLINLEAPRVVNAQPPFPYPPPPPIQPPTSRSGQRNALNTVRSQVNWFRNATRTASTYSTGKYDLIRQQFDMLRQAYNAFKATLTPDRLTSTANEFAELDAGLDILQEAFEEYQQDVVAGRSHSAAFKTMFRLLDEGVTLWLQELNKVGRRLQL